MRMKRERLHFLETNVDAEQNQEEPERPTLSEEVTTLKTLRIPMKRVQLEQVGPLHRRQVGGAGGYAHRKLQGITCAYPWCTTH